MTKKFFNTLKAKQGAQGQDPNTLKYYLIEELGMKYAGYLEGEDKGEISLTYLDFVHKVKPIKRPIGGGSDYIECVIVDKDGNDHPLRMHYKWGDLDTTARDECVHNVKNGVLEKTKPKKHLKTSKTQGFSVVLGKLDYYI